jgi:hypothetical protein
MTILESENTSEYVTSNDITFGEIVFKLKVSPSNIIGTSPFDLWFPNHAGIPHNTVSLGMPAPKLTTEQSGELAKAFFTGASRDSNISEHLSTHYTILTPTTLLEQQRDLDRLYNEVLITGKKDVSIHMGVRNTSAISVEEIFVLPHGDTLLDKNKKPLYRQQLLSIAEQIKSANPHTKISYK